jgi:ketosteroid isomerase-like protein
MTGTAADQTLILSYRQGKGVDEAALANRAALIAAFEALLAGDDAPFWALFHPDAVFHEASCLPYGGAHQGLDAIKRAYLQMCGTFSAMRSEFHEILTAGDYCILYQTIAFTVAANGNTGGFPVAEMFRFEDGKIAEWRANYFDACAMAAAIGGT